MTRQPLSEVENWDDRTIETARQWLREQYTDEKQREAEDLIAEIERERRESDADG